MYIYIYLCFTVSLLVFFFCLWWFRDLESWASWVEGFSRVLLGTLRDVRVGVLEMASHGLGGGSGL